MYKVIIVEDEILVRIGLKTSINWEGLGMEVVDEVANGKLALESYYRHKPDLILTDVKMPVMDGIELIRRIREIDTQVKIVVLTCYEEFSLIHQALKLGVSDYVLKLKMAPPEIENVIARVKREMDSAAHVDHKAAGVLDDTALRNTILKEQVLFNTYDETRFAEMTTQLELPLNPESLRVAVMCAGPGDGQAGQVSESGQFMRNIVLNLVNDLLNTQRMGVAVHEKDNRYILLLNGKESYVGELNTQLDHISAAIKNYIDVRAVFYLSQPGAGYGLLTSLYHRCNELMEQGYFMDADRYIVTNLLKTDEIHALVERKLKNMLDVMATGIKGYMEVITSGVEMLLRSPEIARRDIQHMFSYLIQWPVANFPLNWATMRSLSTEYTDAVDAAQNLDESISSFSAYIATLSRQDSKARRVSREIAEVVQIIGDSYSGNISLQAIAAQVGISPNYLSTLFKKELGMKFVDYINQVRIDHAKELLLNTHLKSYEVAERVGFYDESYFSRIFKSVTGMRPKEWRRQLLEYDGQEAEKTV